MGWKLFCFQSNPEELSSIFTFLRRRPWHLNRLLKCLKQQITSRDRKMQLLPFCKNSRDFFALRKCEQMTLYEQMEVSWVDDSKTLSFSQRLTLRSFQLSVPKSRMVYRDISYTPEYNQRITAKDGICVHGP